MSYFGGLGAGKGWLKFLFLVDPEVLREVLMTAKVIPVITNMRVLADYESTKLDEYIADYSRYLDAMLESAELARKAERRIGLASSLNQFSPMPCPDARYKLMNTDEPVVNLAPLMLYYDSQRGQLCTNVYSNLYFGIEASYPRVISLARDNHELLYETKQFPTYGVFDSMKSQIQKITVPCKIRSPAREHRTQIRITKSMHERMKRHPGLAAAGLELV